MHSCFGNLDPPLAVSANAGRATHLCHVYLAPWQVASANLERREAMPSATATIYLDARTVGRVLVATTPSKRGQEGGKGLMEAYGSAATLGIIR